MEPKHLVGHIREALATDPRTNVLDVTIKVAKDTKVKSKPPMKVEEIKVGTRVVVTATQAKDESFTAKTIEVGAAPAATK